MDSSRVSHKMCNFVGLQPFNKGVFLVKHPLHTHGMALYLNVNKFAFYAPVYILDYNVSEMRNN